VSLLAAEGQVPVQSPATTSFQISELRREIETEGVAHAGAGRLATLWLALADAYQGQVDSESAEDAFAHAIRLLRGIGPSELYLNALDGIATVYFATGRTDSAEKCLRQALELEGTLGGSKFEEALRKHLAIALFMEHKYPQAVTEASESLNLLQGQANPDASEMIVVYLARSRALCGMRRCEEALQGLDRAQALGDSKIGAGPIDLVSIAAIRAMEQVRSGEVDQGVQTIQQALRLVDGRTDIPAPFQIRLRVRLLEEYSQLLGSMHRKLEKKQVDQQLARAKAQQPGCNGCTVSAAALGLFQ
jgi:tetratricopeptide (TPR) repeat protein